MGNQSVVVLIDKGSTHSFVNPNVAKRVNLYTNGSHKLTVMVANGEWVPHLGCCVVVTFQLQGQSFYAQLYSLPSAEFDLVLGMNWLYLLGLIFWDFTKLTMKSTWHRKAIQFQGLGLSDLTIKDVENFYFQFKGTHKGLVLQTMEITAAPSSLEVPQELQPLISKSSSLFQEPQG